MESIQAKLNWRLPQPFVQMIQVAPDDTDRLGHTNNVRYLAWLEQVAWAHIEALGCGWQHMQNSGLAFAITRTEIDYRAASYAGDSLALGTWITGHDRRFTCTRSFELIRTADQQKLLSAQMQFACIKLDNGLPARMPDSFLAALEQGLAATRTD